MLPVARGLAALAFAMTAAIALGLRPIVSQTGSAVPYWDRADYLVNSKRLHWQPQAVQPLSSLRAYSCVEISG